MRLWRGNKGKTDMRMKHTAPIILVALLSSLPGAVAVAQQAGTHSPHTSSAKTQAGAAHSSTTPPTHPITLEQTREMFQLMRFSATMQNMLHANLEQQRQHEPFIPEDVWQDLEASFAKADFVPVFLPVYQKYLSQEDAAKALEFYRTPAGRRTLAVMPAVMQDVAVAAQAKGEEIAQQVFERHRKEIEDAAKKYEQQNARPANPPGGGQQK